ncbi:MAG: GNAT family N-acetyltransferase, partial [Pseudomonadota bacterium]
MSYSILQNQESNRFETTVEGNLCELNYSQIEAVMTMNRVYVPPPVEGRGIAGALTRFALDHCAENHLKVIPRCPYVAAWIK